MPHEIRRILRAFAAQPWFIEPRKAEQIVAALEMRATYGIRSETYRDEPARRPALFERVGDVGVVRLFGPILPRAEAVRDVSQASALMTDFQAAFRQAASDPSLRGIVLEIDSPGGQVDLVPETASMVYGARNSTRPIVAVANTLAASAAYWIASAADEISVTPSGEVGSIGVYTVHEDVSELLANEGVRVTFISEGPRKVEGNPFEPLGDEARTALQANVRAFYDMFVGDVAKGRGIDVSIVRADPETSEKHFGGGRTYPAQQAKKLGMADRVETIEQAIARLQRNGPKAASRRRGLAAMAAAIDRH